MNQLDICFLPLDVPKVPDKEEILSRFDKSPQRDSYSWWNMELLLGERQFETPLGARQYDWLPSARTRYPSLIQWISEYLPFQSLYYVHLAHATKEVAPHVDENYVESPHPHHMAITQSLKTHLTKNEPVGYRFLLRGNRKSLYLCNEYDPNYRDKPDQPKLFCDIPPSTDAFLIRNSEIPHGVENLNEQDTDRVMGFVLGSVDPVEHHQLILQSLEKYKDQARLKSEVLSLKNSSQ